MEMRAIYSVSDEKIFDGTFTVGIRAGFLLTTSDSIDITVESLFKCDITSV